MACNYLFNPPGCLEETGTVYNTKDLLKKQICDGLTNDLSDLWCNNLCGNDTEYYIPVSQGDKLMIQTRFFDNQNFGDLSGSGSGCDDLDLYNIRFTWNITDNGYNGWGSGNRLGLSYEYRGSFSDCNARTGPGQSTPTALIDCINLQPASSDLSDYMQNVFVNYYNNTFSAFVNGGLTSSWQSTGSNSGTLTLDVPISGILLSFFGRTEENCTTDGFENVCDCLENILFNAGLTMCQDEWLFICPLIHGVDGDECDPNSFNARGVFSVASQIDVAFQSVECCCDEVPQDCLGLSTGGCSFGDEFARFVLDIPDTPGLVYGTVNQQAAGVTDSGFVIFLDGSPCSSITYDDVPVLQTLGAATDYNDFLDNVETELNTFWSSVGTSVVTRNGSEFTIDIDKDEFQNQFGIDVCESSFNVCTYNQIIPPEDDEANIVCDIQQDYFEFTLFFEHLQFQAKQPPISISIENDCGSKILANIVQFHGGNRKALLEEIYTSANGLLTGNSSVYPVDIPIYYWSGPYLFSNPEVRPEAMAGLRFRLDLTEEVNSFLCCQNSQPIITFSVPDPFLQSPIPVNDNNYAVNRMQDYITDIWTCCEEPCPNENGYVSFDFNFGNYHKRDYLTVGVIDEIRIYWRTNNNIWTTPLVADTLQYINTYNYSSLYDLLAYFMKVYNFDKSNWVNNGTFNTDGYLSLNGDSMKLHVPTATFGVNDCEDINPVILFKYDNPDLQQI